MSVSQQAAAALPAAEFELLAWATGQRSWTNEHMDVENYNADGTPDRGQTLVRIAERDAAEIDKAIATVRALRLLTGV